MTPSGERETPFYDFHTFAAAYGWSWSDFLECPDKAFGYLTVYISSDQAVENKRLSDMQKRG